MNFASHLPAVLVDDSNYQTLRHVLCFTDNWSFQLDTIHKYATLAHNNIECDAGLLSKPIANKLVRTADGVFVNRDYYNCTPLFQLRSKLFFSGVFGGNIYLITFLFFFSPPKLLDIVCYIRDQVAVARTLYNCK